MADINFGTCSVCKTQKPLIRKYYHYRVDCLCCSGNTHFEYVEHCEFCQPTPPRSVMISLIPIEDTEREFFCSKKIQSELLECMVQTRRTHGSRLGH